MKANIKGKLMVMVLLIALALGGFSAVQSMLNIENDTLAVNWNSKVKK